MSANRKLSRNRLDLGVRGRHLKRKKLSRCRYGCPAEVLTICYTVLASCPAAQNKTMKCWSWVLARAGGWVAKELTERGLTVVMLEAGPPRLTNPRFHRARLAVQLRYRGFGNQQRLLEKQPVQRLCYACDEYSHQFFIDDL